MAANVQEFTPNIIKCMVQSNSLLGTMLKGIVQHFGKFSAFLLSQMR